MNNSYVSRKKQGLTKLHNTGLFAQRQRNRIFSTSGLTVDNSYRLKSTGVEKGITVFIKLRVALKVFLRGQNINFTQRNKTNRNIFRVRNINLHRAQSPLIPKNTYTIK